MFEKFNKIIFVLSSLFAGAGALLMLGIFLTSLIDIFGGKIFAFPIIGVTEIIGLGQAVFITLAIALALIRGQHVTVDFFVSRLPETAQVIVESIVSLALLCLFMILVWQIFRLGLAFERTGEYTSTLRLSMNYFAYIISIAFLPPCLVLIHNIIKSLKKVKNK
jgi:TRAP-type C4-dicarboxylate transport system permease small subunit